MSIPVNLNNLRTLTDGDVALEKELFHEFFISSEECILVLEKYSVPNQEEIWRAAAHAFKGTSINLGADRLSNLCMKAQEMRDVSIPEKQAIVEAIKEEYSQVEQFLKNIHSS